MIGASSYDFSPYWSNRNGLSPLKESISETDGSTATTPIEKLNATSSTAFNATVPTSVAIARAGTGLNNALTSGRQKHSDLDNLMGEFNDLMSHLKASASPFRTGKKVSLTAQLDPDESETIMENSREFLHRTRMDNCGTDVYTDRTDTDYSSADDSASVATIRELSAQQLTACSAAETGAIQSRITTQMMNMYNKNNKPDMSPSNSRNKLALSQQNTVYSSYLPDTTGTDTGMAEGFSERGPRITDSPLTSITYRAQSGNSRVPDRNISNRRSDSGDYDAERVRLVRIDDNAVTDSLTHLTELQGLDDMIGKIDWLKRDTAFPHYFNGQHEDEMRRRIDQQEKERIVYSETGERRREKSRERSRERGRDLGVNKYNSMTSTLSSTYGHTHGSGDIQRINGDVKEREGTFRNENGKDTENIPYAVSSRSLIHGDFKDPCGVEQEQGRGSFKEHLRGNVLEGSYNMTEFNDQKPYNADHRMTKSQLQDEYGNDQDHSQNDNCYESANRHSSSSQSNRQHRYDQHNENEKQYQHTHSEMQVQDPSRRKAEAVEVEETVSEVREREDISRVGRSEYDNHYLAQEERGVKLVRRLNYSTMIKDAEGQSISHRRGVTEEGILFDSDRQYNNDSDVSDRRQRYYDAHTQQSPTSSSSPPSPSSSTTTSTSTSCASSSQYSSHVQNHHGRSLEGVYDHRSHLATALSIPSTHNTATATATAPSSSSSNSSSKNAQLTDVSKWTEKINKEKDIVEQSRRSGGNIKDDINVFGRNKLSRGANMQDYKDDNDKMMESKAAIRSQAYVRYRDRQENEDEEGEEREAEGEEGEGEKGEGGEGEGEGGRIPPAPPSFAEDVNRMQVREIYVM